MESDAADRILGPEAARLLAEAREALDALSEEAAALAGGEPSERQARELREHVDEFFLLVVVGEVKSGKSSFINALLRERVQEEGPLPTTDRIWVLRPGPQPSETALAEWVWERTRPNEMLRRFHIVDTPGTNSIIRRHQQITESFIPRSDLVLFVTSIDRPFSESEHRFLDYVAERWRKKVVFVLTKIDTHGEEDVPVVRRYIEENCRRFYGFTPRVFSISARRAEEARRSGDEALLAQSGLPELERFLVTTLGENERVRLKLTGTLDAGLSVLDDLERALTRRRETLDADFRSLDDLDRQVTQSANQLGERQQAFVLRIYELLREFENRGRSFLDAHLRVRHFALLRKPEAFRRRFEEEVVADLQQRIEREMHAATDWLMKEQLLLFDRALRFLGERFSVERYRDRVATTDPDESGFDYRRDQLVEQIRRAWRLEVERFDVERRCVQVTEQAYRAVLQQLGLQAGAVGLGALLVTLLTGVALDLSGVLAAGLLFAGGFVLLPRRRRRAIAGFSRAVDDLIAQFRKAMEGALRDEIEATMERLRSSWRPYLDFHRSEVERLVERERSLAALRTRLVDLKARAERLGEGGGEAA